MFHFRAFRFRCVILNATAVSKKNFLSLLDIQLYLTFFIFFISDAKQKKNNVKALPEPIDDHKEVTTSEPDANEASKNGN